jgi:hypothetical protein
MEGLTLENQIGWWSNLSSRDKTKRHWYSYSFKSDRHRVTACGRTHFTNNIIEPKDDDEICKICELKMLK